VDEEEVFRALGDPNRRLLLDTLFERDGQTLVELTAHLPGMSRQGVMKHLRALESAGLITTQRVDRRKLHYLNPVPIRLIHDRWISKYAEPWVAALGDLKAVLERRAMGAPSHAYEVYIAAPAERVWQAITDPEMTRRYYYGTLVKSDWQAGSLLRYDYPDGAMAAEGTVLEVDPPRRLVTSFRATWDEDVSADPPVRVTWEIEPAGEQASRLRVLFDGFPGENATYRSVTGGLSVILSGLKTLLETGEPLSVGG
jgi:uncharacterized protein YndB with AHSA1/START domain/DNA-binding transcriptional ArsR family regulator